MFNLGRELAYRDVCIYQNPVAGEKKISAFHYMSIFTIKNCKQILNSSHKKKMHAVVARDKMPGCVKLILKCMGKDDR